MIQLVSIEERKWIEENATITMGESVKYKVIDVQKAATKVFEHRKNENKGMIIIIKPIVDNKYKEISFTRTYFQDPMTGVYYGIPSGQDSYGNIRWSKIMLTQTNTYNLNRRNDLLLWTIVRFCAEVKGSPWQVSTPIFEVIDPEAVAVKGISEVKLLKASFDAINKIENEPVNLLYLARYLGENVNEDTSYNRIYNAVLTSARNNPAYFMEKFNNQERGYYEFVESAIQTQIIEQGSNGNFTYRDINLGLSKGEVVKYVIKDSNIRNSILSVLREKDISAKSIEDSYKEVKGKEEKVKVKAT